MKSNKETICKHCLLIGIHFSFQCPSIRKPIKKPTETEPNKPITATKKKTEGLSLKALKELCQTVVNRYVRSRDDNGEGKFKCICCNVWYDSKEMDAGHYISVKHQATRFDLININGQHTSCNRLEYGRAKEYRESLVNIYGEHEILDLEARSKQIKKWTKEEILALIQKYKEWP